MRRLIQQLPNASACACKPLGDGCYKWQHFSGGPLGGGMPGAAGDPPGAGLGGLGEYARVGSGGQGSHAPGAGPAPPSSQAGPPAPAGIGTAADSGPGPGSHGGRPPVLAAAPAAAALRASSGASLYRQYWQAWQNARPSAPLLGHYDAARHTNR